MKTNDFPSSLLPIRSFAEHGGELAVVKLGELIVGIKDLADDDHGLTDDACLMENVCDGINGAAENTLVRPSRSGYASDRGIARIAAFFQGRHDLIDRLDREENAHGRLMCGKKRELFLRRDRCAAFHTGNDDGLRNAPG